LSNLSISAQRRFLNLTQGKGLSQSPHSAN
jgi:hypothetical protein